MSPAYPTFDLDPFSDESLSEPYDYYRTLRDAGPVFRLSTYDVLGIARFEDVRVALKDWEVFTSAEGPGLNDPFNAQMRGSVVCAEPPEHEAIRTVMVRRLRLAKLKEVVPLADQLAADMVDGFLERGTFDGVQDFAQPFVTQFVGSVLGISQEIVTQSLAASIAGFNMTGPLNARAMEGGPVVAALFEVMRQLTKSDTAPESIGWDILDAHERGEIPFASSLSLMWNFLGPAFDTTINAIGTVVWLLANNPDQWKVVREDPSLIPALINEAIRVESPLQIWSRVARTNAVVDGVEIPAGTRVAIFMGSANRDERHYKDPDRFDVRRNPTDHLGFGQGIHMCVGAPLARLELTSVLKALTEKVSTLDVAGPTTRRLNNTTRGFASLPVTVS